GPEVRIERAQSAGPLEPYRITVESGDDAPVTASAFTVHAGEGFVRTVVAPLVRLGWDLRLWEWATDPLTDREGWLGEGEGLTTTRVNDLDFPFGNGGPPNAPANDGQEPADPVVDGFGLIAQTSTRLPAGRWRLRTLSDDGIRVLINGQTVIDRWDIHGPTPDEAVFVSDGQSPTTIRVEYFENDGFATLRVGLEPV
ncbi:MAG: hypothetical protein ACI89L_001690, partial [Phycisphaerales bacterium]